MRQYIGARYVPKFMGTYDATQIYEALSVVDNGLGTSYISKVPTPAGTPLTDTNYWAIYGASSGAIINLQNQIDTINNTTIPAVTNEIGNLSDLDTSDQTSIVNAINEVNSNLTSWGEFNRQYGGKKIAIVGDSLSTRTNTWAEDFKTMAEGFGCTVDNYSVSGGTTATLLPIVQSISDAYDAAIIWLGVNDANNAYPIGTVSTANTYIYNMIQMIAKFTTLNGLCKIFAIATPYAGNITLSRTKSTYYYNAALLQVCKIYGAAFKDLSNICNTSYYNHSALAPDEVHFYGTESKGMVLNAILNKMLVPTSDTFDQVVNFNETDVAPATGVTVSTLRGRFKFGDYIFFNAYITLANNLSSGDTILSLPTPIKGTYINQVLLIDTTGKCYFGLCSLTNDVTIQGAIPAGVYRMFCIMTMQEAANITFTIA